MVIKHLETDEEINGKAYVHWQAWKEAYAGLVDQDFLNGRTPEMSWQRAKQAFDNGFSTLVALTGGRVIGFADYGPYRGDDLTDTDEIYAIYILKEYYGKGVGYALMSKAVEQLKDCQQVAAWVLEGNERAIRFYTRYGFRFDGRKQELQLGTTVNEMRMILNR